METHVDPILNRVGRLVGQILDLHGRLSEVFMEIEISYYILRCLQGVKTLDCGRHAQVQKLSKGEIFMTNIGFTGTGGNVEGVRSDLATISLIQPVCTLEGEKFVLSTMVDKYWRLIGWGNIKRGKKIKVLEP